MIKVLYILSTLQRGGPVNIIYNIIKYLDRNKYQPIILTLSPEKDNSRKEDFVSLGIVFHTINFTPLSIFLGGIGTFQKKVNEINPDVIHTTGIRADLLAAYFVKRGSTKITSQLNYPFEDYVLTYGKVVGYLMAWSTKKSFSKFDFPLACSKDIVEKFKAKGVELGYIYNGIDTAVFPVPTDTEIRKNKADLDLDEFEKIFIFVGVLTERKLPDVAIKAFIKFQSNHPRTCLLVIGDGTVAEHCKTISKGFNIKFLGTVAETRKYLICSDYYIATSKAEGLPASVLEALALKIPVVLSNILPHEEILSFNNDAGELALVNDIEATADAMERIVTKNIDVQNEAAFSIIKDHLNAKYMSEKYQEFYNKNKLAI